jgi:hypothetical protein
MMRVRNPISPILVVALLVPMSLAAIGMTLEFQAPAGANRQAQRDWPFGQYQVVENRPKPLSDTRHSHDGWTWGWMGSVYAGTDRILKFDLNGNYSWGAAGGQPGRFDCPHGLSTDQDRNFYVADCFAGRVQKFTPVNGSDPAKLVGQILRYPFRN